MKSIRINPLVSGKGIFIRYNDGKQPESAISRQSFNWWINHELKDYLKQGYRIDYSDQRYNPHTKRFV